MRAGSVIGIGWHLRFRQQLARRLVEVDEHSVRARRRDDAVEFEVGLDVGQEVAHLPVTLHVVGRAIEAVEIAVGQRMGR